MFNKALLSALVLATTVAGASLLAANSASALTINSASAVTKGGGGEMHLPAAGLTLNPGSSQTGDTSSPTSGGGFGGGFGGPAHGNSDLPAVQLGSAGISCGTAAAIVRSHGFHGVQAMNCGGGAYAFSAFKRGVAFEVAVSRKGRILNVSVL